MQEQRLEQHRGHDGAQAGRPEGEAGARQPPARAGAPLQRDGPRRAGAPPAPRRAPRPSRGRPPSRASPGSRGPPPAPAGGRARPAGAWRASAASASPAPASAEAAIARSRPADDSGPAQRWGRRAAAHEQPGLDRARRQPERTLPPPEAARTVELGGAEVRCRRDRIGRRASLPRAQQDHGALRRGQRGRDGRSGPKALAHARAPHAGRDPLRHPRQPPRPRGGPRGRGAHRRGAAVVPGRRRGLRRRPQRLLRDRPPARRSSAWPATTTWP